MRVFANICTITKSIKARLVGACFLFDRGTFCGKILRQINKKTVYFLRNLVWEEKMVAMVIAQVKGRKRTLPSFQYTKRQLSEGMLLLGIALLLFSLFFLFTHLNAGVVILSLMLIMMTVAFVTTVFILFQVKQVFYYYLKKELQRALADAKRHGGIPSGGIDFREYKQSEMYKILSFLLEVSQRSHLPAEWILPMGRPEKYFSNDELLMLRAHLWIAQTQRHEGGFYQIRPCFQNLEARVNESLIRKGLY